jgi:hypothetical protein
MVAAAYDMYAYELDFTGAPRTVAIANSSTYKSGCFYSIGDDLVFVPDQVEIIGNRYRVTRFLDVAGYASRISVSGIAEAALRPISEADRQLMREFFHDETRRHADPAFDRVIVE